jgi:AcrR family transcriptional regulator
LTGAVSECILTPAVTPSTSTRKLSTAEDRREALLAAAMPIFAARGYHAAPTLEIAKAAGISQAYVFRLFPTKAELFAAVCELARGRMLATFGAAAARAPSGGAEALREMGEAYVHLLENDRDVLLIQLHSQVAAGQEPLIRDAMRRTFHAIYELVARESGAGEDELRTWFAHGMLCNVMAAIDAGSLDDEWARALTAAAHEES